MLPRSEARIESALLERAHDTPHGTAVVEGAAEVSYAELASRSAAVARALREARVVSGQQVTVYLDKTTDAVAALYGVWFAGAVAVPASETLKARQLGHVLRHSESRALISSRAKLQRVGPLELDGVPLVLVDSAQSHASIEPQLGGGRDPAAILYTSGSTGLPKGIVLSHDNLIAGTRIVSGYLEIAPSDRIASVLPFSFDYGLNQLLTAVSRGAALVLQRSHLPADICRTLIEQRVTGLAGVPTLWVQLMSPGSPFASLQFPALRYLTNSGGTFPKELVRTYRAHSGHVRIYLMYGLTEAFRSTYLPPELVDRLPTSIGKAIPETEITVVDDVGNECAPGEVGELVHRGPTVALGYWHDPQATALRFRPDPRRPTSRERVVYSGDLVRKDEDGFLYYVGRGDQLLKCYGHRVSPEEVEAALMASDLLQEAVVRGEPDDIAGTRVVAHVVPGSDRYSDAALVAWCRREMPGYMVPVRIVRHDSFPRTSSLKVAREEVRG